MSFCHNRSLNGFGKRHISRSELGQNFVELSHFILKSWIRVCKTRFGFVLPQIVSGNANLSDIANVLKLSCLFCQVPSPTVHDSASLW